MTGPTRMVEIGEDDQCHERDFDAASCEIAPATLAELKGGSASDNAATARELLAGGGPAALRDAVALNAGAALYVSGGVPDIAAGYQRARGALAGGAAAAKLEQVIATARALLDEPEPAPAGSTAEAAERPRVAAAAATNGAGAAAHGPRPS